MFVFVIQDIIDHIHRQTVTTHPELFEFKMGVSNLSYSSENMQQRKAVAMFMHPDYKINGGDHEMPDLGFDIALFKLERQFSITDYVRTVCLPREDMFDFPEDAIATVTGWGKTEHGK